MATSGGPAREEGQLPGCRRLRVPGRHALRVAEFREAAGLARDGALDAPHRLDPLARVCLAFVTGCEGVAHASAHASTWSGGILPRLIVPYSGASLGGRSRSLIAPGAASCSRQGNVDVVPGAASYSRQNNVAIVPGAVSSSPPGPGRRSTAGGRGETADAIPACPAPACERAPLEAVMRAPPREARSGHHAARGGARPAASLPGPSPELTAARPASRPSVPCDDGGDWPWPAVPAA